MAKIHQKLMPQQLSARTLTYSRQDEGHKTETGRSLNKSHSTKGGSRLFC